MPTFEYKAMNKQGKEVKGSINAENSADAMVKLRKDGVFPTTVVEKGVKKSLNFELELFKQKTLNSKEFVVFLRQFATLLDAGLPLLRCIQVLYEQQKKGLLKDTLRDISVSVESGSALSEVLARYPNLFEKLFVNMIRAGEVAGILDTVLNRLAEYYEKSAKLKSRVKTAMIYPSFVVAISVLVVVFLVYFIVPRFSKMFLEMNLELPAITAMLITVSDFMQQRWPFIIVGLALVFTGMKFFTRSEKGKKLWNRLLLDLWGVGGMMRKIITASLTRTLGTLLNSGVPILEALSIVKGTVKNELVVDAILEVHNRVREGESMVIPLQESGIFAPMVVNMVEVGEATGKISEMLLKVADIYDDEVDNAVTAMTSLIEPILIVSLALIVGFIVIAMFLPLISIISGINA